MKILFINISDDGDGLGSKSISALRKKCDEELLDLIEAGELAYDFFNHKETNIDNKIQENIKKIQTQIKEFNPKKIMLGVHGHIDDTQSCYYIPFAKSSLRLSNVEDLADFFCLLTKEVNCFDINLIMCYGARTNDYLSDHSENIVDFSSTFAYNFLKQMEKNLPGASIMLEAALGTTGFDDKTGKQLVESETQIQLNIIKFEHKKFYHKNEQQLQILIEDYIKNNGMSHYIKYMTDEDYKNDLSEFGIKNRDSQIGQELTPYIDIQLDAINMLMMKPENGVIQFKLNESNKKGIYVQRKYNDQSCDWSLISSFSQQIEAKCIELKSQYNNMYPQNS